MISGGEKNGSLVVLLTGGVQYEIYVLKVVLVGFCLSFWLLFSLGQGNRQRASMSRVALAFALLIPLDS